ncbi:5-oxoprolinase subunit PxpB [Clostridioides sp. ZZV14-6009]|uniref:5-oxoprolinase subunit PxpB n=1 Tax=unclassified Clostridioides TaxID=2635829 RepID=UPI001D10E663|nr:5-oxoprolinase subunit PxpB [Clostridioides sp. ZZV14-6153]MCC0733912.1 5-oxoprolinase subunit PxpB [Clostridioides sp. ZZV14-6009]
METRYLLSGDKAVVAEFGNEISEDINKKVISFMRAIEISNLKGIVTEMVPTYRSLMISYNPLKIDFDSLIESLKKIENNLESIELPKPKMHEIPVCYDKVFGIDIETVASYNNLTVDEVINIHTGREYLIYMLGFTPGFPYLGGMDERIATPRLEVPRIKIYGGSVGIAGSQTGVYPIDSPGGWQIIGRTPLKLYDENREEQILLRAGDFIKFVPITLDEFIEIEKNNLSV